MKPTSLVPKPLYSLGLCLAFLFTPSGLAQEGCRFYGSAEQRGRGDLASAKERKAFDQAMRDKIEQWHSSHKNSNITVTWNELMIGQNNRGAESAQAIPSYVGEILDVLWASKTLNLAEFTDEFMSSSRLCNMRKYENHCNSLYDNDAGLLKEVVTTLKAITTLHITYAGYATYSANTLPFAKKNKLTFLFPWNEYQRPPDSLQAGFYDFGIWQDLGVVDLLIAGLAKLSVLKSN